MPQIAGFYYRSYSKLYLAEIFSFNKTTHCWYSRTRSIFLYLVFIPLCSCVPACIHLRFTASGKVVVWRRFPGAARLNRTHGCFIYSRRARRLPAAPALTWEKAPQLHSCCVPISCPLSPLFRLFCPPPSPQDRHCAVRNDPRRFVGVRSGPRACSTDIPHLTSLVCFFSI